MAWIPCQTLQGIAAIRGWRNPANRSGPVEPADSRVAARDCRPTAEGDCVVAGIERFKVVLADRTRPQDARAEAFASSSGGDGSSGRRHS